MIATPFTDLFARSPLSSGLGHLVRSHLTGLRSGLQKTRIAVVWNPLPKNVT
jgi:hypothetical protein